jgi:hypothetical protein
LYDCKGAKTTPIIKLVTVPRTTPSTPKLKIFTYKILTGILITTSKIFIDNDKKSLFVALIKYANMLFHVETKIKSATAIISILSTIKSFPIHRCIIGCAKNTSNPVDKIINK